MLLIHVPKLTNRLGYTLKVVFNHLLHAEYSITTDAQYFLQYGDAKLSYGRERLGDSLFIKSHRLLFETTIEDQEPRAECTDGQWILFPVYGRDLDFSFDPRRLFSTWYRATKNTSPTTRTSTAALCRARAWLFRKDSSTNLLWISGLG